MKRSQTECKLPIFSIQNRKIHLQHMPKTKDDFLKCARAIENARDDIAKIIFEPSEWSFIQKQAIRDNFISYFYSVANHLAAPETSLQAVQTPKSDSSPLSPESSVSSPDSPDSPDSTPSPVSEAKEILNVRKSEFYQPLLERKIEILVLEAKLTPKAQYDNRQIHPEVMSKIIEITELKTKILMKRNEKAQELKSDHALSPTDLKSHRGSLHALKRSSTLGVNKHLETTEKDMLKKTKGPEDSQQVVQLELELEALLKKHHPTEPKNTFKDNVPTHFVKPKRDRSLEQIIRATSPKHFKKTVLDLMPSKPRLELEVKAQLRAT